MSAPERDRVRLPAAVEDAASRLDAAGHPAWLVGESLARVLHAPAGDAPPACSAWELATTADVDTCLGLFPTAVPTRPARGVVSLPARPAPIDLLSLRWGGHIEDDLAHRDFSMTAMAWSPAAGEWVDPAGGRADLAAGRLRCVGDPVARLHEDPVRILRAARWVAEWGLVPDASVEAAMRQVAPALAAAPAPRLRAELYALLLADGVAAGLALLRRTGVEQRLVRNVRDDAAELVARMPRSLDLRLAAWLRGTPARGLFKRLRVGLDRAQRVERLLESHPLDETVDPGRDRSVLRLRRLHPPAELEALFTMREQELASESDPAGPHKRLAELREALERVQRNEEQSARLTGLCIDGDDVMRLLGCGPGRRVGAALRFAADRVAADPACNQRDALLAEIRAWDAHEGPAGSDG